MERGWHEWCQAVGRVLLCGICDLSSPWSRLKSNVRLLELVWNKLVVDKEQLSALILKDAKDASMAEVSMVEATALVEQALAAHRDCKREVGQLASTPGVHAEHVAKAKQASARGFKAVVAAKKIARPVNEALAGLEHSAVVKEAMLAIANEAARALGAATAAKEATTAATREVEMLIAASLETATSGNTAPKDSTAHIPTTPNSPVPKRPAQIAGAGSDSGCCQVS